MTDEVEENWKPIVNLEGYYEVSDLGRVRSLDRTVVASNGAVRRLKGRILRSARIGPRRYAQVVLSHEGVQVSGYVARLVMEAFVGPSPPDHFIARLGAKNDESLSNLSYEPIPHAPSPFSKPCPDPVTT